MCNASLNAQHLLPSFRPMIILLVAFRGTTSNYNDAHTHTTQSQQIGFPWHLLYLISRLRSLVSYLRRSFPQIISDLCIITYPPPLPVLPPPLKVHSSYNPLKQPHTPTLRMTGAPSSACPPSPCLHCLPQKRSLNRAPNSACTRKQQQHRPRRHSPPHRGTSSVKQPPAP